MADFSFERYVAPTYSSHEVQALRIKQVHFLPEHVLFLLSDDKILCLPMTPILAGASQEDRYQWQLVGEGRAVVWHTGRLEERLTLRRLLEHPEAKVGDLAGSPSPFPPL